MIYEYIKLIQEKEILENKIYILEQELKCKMISEGVSEIKNKAGSVFLTNKGRTKKLTTPPSKKEVELSSSLKDKIKETLDSNKESIYKLEKERFLAENNLKIILDFPDLSDKIVEERKSTLSKNLNVVEKYSLKTKLSKEFYTLSIDKDFISKMYSESSKSKVLDFSKKFFLGYFPDLTIQEAWNKYLLC